MVVILLLPRSRYGTTSILRWDEVCQEGWCNPFDSSLPLRMKTKESVDTRRRIHHDRWHKKRSVVNTRFVNPFGGGVWPVFSVHSKLKRGPYQARLKRIHVIKLFCPVARNLVMSCVAIF